MGLVCGATILIGQFHGLQNLQVAGVRQHRHIKNNYVLFGTLRTVSFNQLVLVLAAGFIFFVQIGELLQLELEPIDARSSGV